MIICPIAIAHSMGQIVESFCVCQCVSVCIHCEPYKKVTTYVQNVRLWLKHKLASMLAIGQLYHQSATALRCTTQLRDVRGLPLPARRSSKPVSCTSLDNFLLLFVSNFIRTFPNQTPSTVAF